MASFVINELNSEIAQQEMHVQQIQDMLSEEQVKLSALLKTREYFLAKGTGSPTVIRSNQASESEKPATTHKSNVEAYKLVLLEFDGALTHVDVILKQLKERFGLEVKKQIAASTLRKYAKKNRIFIAGGGNKFGLRTEELQPEKETK